IEMVEGMQFDRGYCSAYFCTNMEKMTIEMQQAKILITDKKISSIQEIVTLLQSVAGTAQDFLIIADDVEGDALSTLVINKLRGTLKVCAVKAPGFGDRRKGMLEDIAILTGATVVSEELGIKLENVELSQLGRAKKNRVDKDNPTIIEGAGNEKAIKGRIDQLKHEIEATTSDYDREKLQERLAKLAGGVAQIQVG